MKEVKRTLVPLPGSKAKSRPNSTPPKAPLSQEFIGSDADSSAETSPKPKTAEKPQTTIAIHRPKGVAKSKAKSTAKEVAPPKSSSKLKPSSKARTPNHVVTEAQVAELSSSEQTDDSDAPIRNTQKTLPANGKSQEAVSDSSSDSSSDELDAGKTQPGQKPATAQAPSLRSQPHAVEFRPAQSYVPPNSFNPVPLNDKTTSKSAQIFDNLAGKQIWHITAPAGVSMKDLKDIAMARALKGEAILDHKGTSYGFSRSEQSEVGTCGIMVPQRNGYKAVATRMSRTLHLRAAVQLPQLSSKQANPNTGSEAAASITRSTIRAPRPQLKDLKMRFLPTGFGGGDTGTLGDSESEDETPRETTGLGMPNGLNLPPRTPKRKRVEVNGDARTDSLSKKHKKHRTPEEVRRKEETRREKKEKKRAQDAASAKS